MLTNVGLLTEDDAKILSNAVTLASTRFPSPNIVEIGVNNGNTARAIERELEGKVNYVGIDNENDMKIEPPFEGAKLVLGDSAEVFSHPDLPEEIHLLIIDGCHCVNHVVLDFLHYGRRVPKGGLIFFHDTAPHWQGIQGDRQPHGPAQPEFCVGVLAGLERVWPVVKERWDLVAESFPGWGGARLYQRRGGNG